MKDNWLVLVVLVTSSFVNKFLQTPHKNPKALQKCGAFFVRAFLGKAHGPLLFSLIFSYN